LLPHATVGLAMVVAVARLLAYVVNDRDRWRRFLFLVLLALAVAAVWWVLVDGGVHVLLLDFARPGHRLLDLELGLHDGDPLLVVVRCRHGSHPGELELADQYGVSRDTIRRAIQELVSENRLVVLHGRGTFVKPQP
jgi:hypothetical protein